MKQPKLAAAIFLFASLFIFACRKDEGKVYSKSGSPMNGAQVVPANSVSSTTTATGSIDASYDQKTKMLSYTITWTGLSTKPLATVLSSSATGSVPIQAGLYIHGPADPGFVAPPISSTANPPLLYIQAPASTSANLQASGSFSGSLFIDGTKVKEEDVLNNKLYAVLRTTTTQSATSGEIRGQIMVR